MAQGFFGHHIEHVENARKRGRMEVSHETKKSQIVLVNEIASDMNLNPTEKFVLQNLFVYRFSGNNDPSYIREWAHRILEAKAYARADSKTANVLYRAGMTEYVVVGYNPDGNVFDFYKTFNNPVMAENLALELRKYETGIKDESKRRKFVVEDAYKFWFIKKGTRE